MNGLLQSFLWLPLVIAPALPHAVQLGREAASLHALQDESLAELRARGASSPAQPASADELRELARADASARDLETLRGGDISNEDLKTILLILGIVVLVLIIV